jgi:methylenetetrahydrofolate dehydrogenase (NADP+) / methenyltetrahydrofolate cyclohydrolase
MTAQIIDGKKYADEIRAEVAEKVKERLASGKNAPGLATVLVGDDPASHTYVRSKHKACQQVGIQSFSHELPANCAQEKVQELIIELNEDKRVHGILVQLPLPKGLDEEKVLSAVSVDKDVDGFHPINIGRLAQKGRQPRFVPCTPAGVIYLLEKTLPSLEGKNAVVVGRSNIVGMPVALLLVRANATVTICHSRTQDLPVVVRSGDIVVAAIGKPGFVRGDWIKPGAVVIDVGINHVDDAASEKGYRLVGDVAFEEAKEVASAITLVPGGVGPMTIAMLLKSTLKAAEVND